MTDIMLPLSVAQANILLQLINNCPVSITVKDLRSIASGTKEHSLTGIANNIEYAIRRAEATATSPAEPVEGDSAEN